jgi:hypothetical protein
MSIGKVHHRYQRQPVANLPPAVNSATGTAGVVNTGGKFNACVNSATGVNDTGGK